MNGPEAGGDSRRTGAIRKVMVLTLFFLLLISACALAAGLLLRQPSFRKIPYGQVFRSDPAILRSHVEFLSNQCQGRNCANPAILNKAANYIEKTFSLYSGEVESQTWEDTEHNLRNVIARFGPDRGKLFVIGAHYDVYGDTKGADDNASGIAGILELARLFSIRNPETPVQLVAYPNLEPPYFAGPNMGSSVHAKSLKESGKPVRGVVSLDMIGYYSEKQNWPYFFIKLLYPVRGNFIAIGGRWKDRVLAKDLKAGIAGAGGVRAVSYSGAVIVGVELSDHRSYWEYGYPAVIVTDTAFMRNDNYHTPRDTPETLDYGKMARVVDGVFNTALSYRE